MFALKIHTSQPPVGTLFGGVRRTSCTRFSIAGGLDPYSYFIPTELKGVAHLFRNLPLPTFPYGAPGTLFDGTKRTSCVFIVAVPCYLSYADFIAFCGSQIIYISDLCFIRNDAVGDRYSVLINLANQDVADAFFRTVNGKLFRPSGTEVCHTYFVRTIEYIREAEIASNPYPCYTEMPSCPVCLDRLDQETSAIKITVCDHSFQCSCVTKWSCKVCSYYQQQNGKPTCAVCGTSSNLWVCLICSFVGCGRDKGGHAMKHYQHFLHSYTLELETRNIWDYVCDKYVHRLNQSKSGSKSIATNHQCSALEDKYDDKVGGTLYSNKLDRIIDQYNILIATRMATERQLFETLLAEAKIQKKLLLAKAIEKAEAETTEQTQEIQYELEKVTKEIESISKNNENLLKEKETLKKN